MTCEDFKVVCNKRESEMTVAEVASAVKHICVCPECSVFIDDLCFVDREAALAERGPEQLAFEDHVIERRAIEMALRIDADPELQF